MSDDVQKKVISDLTAECEHNKTYKNRYEKIVDQLAGATDDQQK